MEINYDKQADAMYIEFRKGQFAKSSKIKKFLGHKKSRVDFLVNKKTDDFTIIDLDEKGNILGIELLDASKRIPPESLSEIHVKNIIAVEES